MASHVLDNAQLWIGDGTSFRGHVVLDGQTIADVAPGAYVGDLPTEDLHGAALSPGLVDLMVLGGFELSILRDDPCDIARNYLRLGVTSIQFCSGTLPWPAMNAICDKIRPAQGQCDVKLARILGLYLEGPFQQPDLTGASMREYALSPTAETVQRLLDDFGSAVTMVNVAPSWSGAPAAVRKLRQHGKVISMAHSNAPAREVLDCLGAGTTVLGHCWDNNSGLIGDSGVQQPTLEHVALVDERVRALHLISDGVHVDPLLVKLILRCRGVEAVCLVTDAVIRAGCPDGPYEWDDGRRFHKKGGVGRTDTGWLAGSALLLPDQFRNFIRMTGLRPDLAIRTVTHNPARSLGVSDQIGLVAPGRSADLVQWDDRLRIDRVWRAGVELDDVSACGEVRL